MYVRTNVQLSAITCEKAASRMTWRSEGERRAAFTRASGARGRRSFANKRCVALSPSRALPLRWQTSASDSLDCERTKRNAVPSPLSVVRVRVARRCSNDLSVCAHHHSACPSTVTSVRSQSAKTIEVSHAAPVTASAPEGAFRERHSSEYFRYSPRCAA